MKLVQALKRNHITINKYENLITKLQNEINKLKKKYHLSILSANREKETYLSILSQNTRNPTSDNTKISNSQNLPNISLIPSDDFKLKSKLKLDDSDYSVNIHSFDEFSQILRNVGLSKIEFQKMTKMKNFCKLTDAVEMIFGFLVDKNSMIKILKVEIENLTNKNFLLNKENIILSYELKKMKNSNNNIINNNNNNNNNIIKDNNINNINNIIDNNNIDNFQNSNKTIIENKKESIDETLSNNASQITANKALNLDLFNNYQKFIERNENDDEELTKHFESLGFSTSFSKKLENYEQFVGNKNFNNSFNFSSSNLSSSSAK